MKLLQGRVILQSLGQLLRNRVPDFVICEKSQANDIRGVDRESCIIRKSRWERASNKPPLTIKVKLLQGRVILQSLGNLLRTRIPDLVTCATSQAKYIRGAVRQS